MSPEIRNEFTKSINEGLGNFIEIEMEKATDKQRETLQVSSYDNRSTLGKTYTQLRKERRELNQLNMGESRVRTHAEKINDSNKRKIAKKSRKKNRK
jgi:hypothetical protein